MHIKINGKNKSVKDDISILDLLTSNNLNPNNVVIEYNYTILEREEWQDTILKENDNLEVLSFVGGG
ncbi:thiamine biosynthesis protein ThiS [Gottschalkia purinilytica]|uniref:Thiamine biosynthesis protein ThiS n=1 Tax=Gottschalkia purinilytica TaxID=1503 RepID=A0A0L0WEZ1_GOTPU|nr:sulfur carrier protein ThiS [Gottschalkia purinilytica]KNF10039.1 thiamine biosynthesis protein ThiS [Gottschalkia purinilytica]